MPSSSLSFWSGGLCQIPAIMSLPIPALPLILTHKLSVISSSSHTKHHVLQLVTDMESANVLVSPAYPS